MSLELLPGDCFAHILAFASPRDACRCSVVSPGIRSLTDSDAVWDNFLPYDYREIIARMVTPDVFRSKKEIFMKLCEPLLIDGGTKTFWIDKSTGKKCYRLNAKHLSITLAENPLFWSWKPHPQSRFSEVAELRTIWWLEIKGMVKTIMLSPDTLYGVYLILQLADRAYGLDCLASEIILEFGSFKLLGTVHLCRYRCKEQVGDCTSHRNRNRMLGSSLPEGMPCEREDGWMEVEIGAFYRNHGGDEDQNVKICLREIKGQHLKGGLIVEGLEIRPKLF
ncbi:F-box protein PP2-B15-like [Punica granatum]|uniref:F-box domain-containing protein n=2 Tax=Punica granatum TaxID=22663 RepID=A0A218VQY5_PUNGR|nr:F-box protein PP2-B15-like [Punica granatum]OWM62915.1 hypothetical protein CDL15_Pgr020209 [Punica granatum]PKI51482.1 hypothetical protein CRG98_028042 [Punica granatum]